MNPKTIYERLPAAEQLKVRESFERVCAEKHLEGKDRDLVAFLLGISTSNVGEGQHGQ